MIGKAMVFREKLEQECHFDVVFFKNCLVLYGDLRISGYVTVLNQQL